ncbi:30S ribosomal protein S6 [Candidatus Curtissbacteria bacterium]|nr:30S ribosomal protein S6 [Candidatus Curtissbacteria bacterium]
MNYELMMVVKVDEAESLFSKTEKNIKELSTDLKVTRMGRKNLAYSISGQSEAEYFVFNFTAEGDAVNRIASKLRLEQEMLLRYLITKTKGSQIKATEARKVTVKTVAKPKKEGLVKETKVEVKTKVKPKAVKAKTATKAKVKKGTR